MGAFARTAAVLTHITDHVTKDFDKKRESAFISAKEMDDYCAVLASTIEAKQWEALIYVATQDKIIPVQPTYTPVMLQKLSIKLKDSDFRDRVVMQAKADAYGLKARDGITADLIARVAQFDSARDEAQKALQKIREDGAEELEKLRVQLKQKENQINQQIDSHKLAWAPIYFYETPLDNEIKRKKWNSYTAVELAAGRPAPPKSDEHFDRCLNMFRSECIEEHKADYVKDANVQTFLDNWVQATIQKFDTAGQTRRGNAFRPSTVQRLERLLLSHPLPHRLFLAMRVPVGSLSHPRGQNRVPLSQILNPGVLSIRQVRPVGGRDAGARLKRMTVPEVSSRRGGGGRLRVVSEAGPPPPRGIVTACSAYERGCRRVIGGGEMLNFDADMNMVRGGGDLGDAYLILLNNSVYENRRYLDECFTVDSARKVLGLPCNLDVPDGRLCVHVKHWNGDATAGPVLRAFGIKGKQGLQKEVEDMCWEMYDRVGSGEIPEGHLPFILCRLGYRTKLLRKKEAFEKLERHESMGRAVMMMDAVEQVFNTPLYNALDAVVMERCSDVTSPWKNKLVRASSDWALFYQRLKEGKSIIEMDWGKFDVRRPARDIDFMIKVFKSCFHVQSGREKRLLSAYILMMQRSLLGKRVVMDNGGAIDFDGMVPSGSLFTNMLDTGLNILYTTAAMRGCGLADGEFQPCCAGDDSLTIMLTAVNEHLAVNFKNLMNTWFWASIKDEEYMWHKPPYHVFREQAVFPPGLDLSQGTSKHLDKAVWERFDSEMVIDEERGLSHRWRFHFHGRPKFLSCFWLEDGRPIRPNTDAHERLLWPEGVHKSIDDYIGAVISMVVDNPFNDHTVNHMMHRLLIAQEVKLVSCSGVHPELIFKFIQCGRREMELAPYPSVGYWRRGDQWVDLEADEVEGPRIKNFKDFLNTVSSLYLRKGKGGVDAWMFNELLRGERYLHPRQIGSDLIEWYTRLGKNPLTKSLRSVRRFKADMAPATQVDYPPEGWPIVLQFYMAHFESGDIQTPDAFCLLICNRLRNYK
ncbi:TPA_asm: fusion protein [Isoetes lacustris amalgavirus 1]|nr:TPA_asm: fusion protein [Isoetes lacustris amalgavirus 1]